MITIKGKEYDFSLTNPEHLKRFRDAANKMQQSLDALKAEGFDASALEKMDDPTALDSYIAYLEKSCMLYANVIDDVLGNGTANAAFGAECSFEELFDFWMEFKNVVESDSARFQKRMKTWATPVGTKGKPKK